MPLPLRRLTPADRSPRRPVVIGHRGACGYRPEHTLASYRLAVELGADYLEPDLVSTKDGVLVCRHENEISATTDVATRPELADRRTTKVVDGREVTGWFTEDLTFAELRSLRAVERIPHLRPAGTLYDGRYRVPALHEVLALARSASLRLGRTVGVYPETKSPSYFRSIGLPLEEPLVRTLERHGYRSATDPVLVQSFEIGNLQELAQRTDVRLVQLVRPAGAPADRPATPYAALTTAAGLAQVAEYAHAIGPHKDLVIGRQADGSLGPATGLVGEAHEAGLQVHAYTFRRENAFLPADLRRGSAPAAYGRAATELRAFYRAGVDGVFSDHPDLAGRVRDQVLAAA